MRPGYPILVLLLVACGEEQTVVVSELSAEREPVRCVALDEPRPAPSSVTHLVPATDSSFLLVDEAAREVGLLGASAQRIWTLRFTEEGPLAIGHLADAAISGDTLLVVADGGMHRLRAFAPSGRERWSVQTPFPVQRISYAGDRLLIAAIGLDPRVPGLLHELEGGRLVPLRVPFEAHADALVRMFLNAVTLQGYPDGAAIVATQFVTPMAWRVGATEAPERVPLPVAEATAEAAGWVPPMPFRQEDLERIAAPVIESAADPLTGGLFYLTRTGRRRGDYSEKVVVRLDRNLAYTGSVLLEQNAVGLAYLPAVPESLIVVDFEQAWYRCPAP